MSAAVTEKGRIACDTVVLAGGAWCRLFCGNLGIELPQLGNAGDGHADRAARRRPGNLCLGWAVRLSQADGRRLHRRDPRGAHDRPRSRSFSAVLRLPAGSAITLEEVAVPCRPPLVEEWRMPRGWGLDEPSPFEVVRVLDPEPDRFVVDRARAATAEAFPVFRKAVVAESWGGMIDVMPDAIPVISPVDGLPGFFVATGSPAMASALVRGRQVGGGYGRGRPDLGRSGTLSPLPVHRRVKPTAAPAGELMRCPGFPRAPAPRRSASRARGDGGIRSKVLSSLDSRSRKQVIAGRQKSASLTIPDISEVQPRKGAIVYVHDMFGSTHCPRRAPPSDGCFRRRTPI